MKHVQTWVLSKRFHLLTLVLYIILTVVMTWPVVGRLGTHIPGQFGDAWVHVWTFHWIKEALLSGQNPFYTELLYFPQGVTLFFHNIAWLHIAVWLPLQALVGEWPAYALVFIAIYTFNGFATYLLAWEYTKSFGASFVAGLIVGFWPYIMSRNDHPNLILIGCIPLLLLYLTRLFGQQKKWDVVLAALFLALLGYSRWQLLIIGGVLIVLFILYQFLTDASVRTVQIVKRLALFVGLAGLLMAPLFAPVLYAQLTRDYPEDASVAESIKGTDLLAYVVPNVNHPLWGEQVANRFPQIFSQEEYVPFIGYTVLLLALIGIFTRRKQTRFWWIAALLLMVLAMGMVLVVNGRSYPIPLPYRIIQNTFIAQVIRQPIRFNVILSIPLAMLAAWGIVSICDRFTRKIWTFVIVGIASLLILVEYAVSFPTLALEIPDWYQTVVAPDPDDYGILGIPMNPRRRPDKLYMFYQTQHGKPLVEGHVSRIPREAMKFIDTLSFSDTLLADTKSVPDTMGVGSQMALLNAANVRYVVLHKQLTWPGEIEAWKRWLVRDPDYEDDEVAVYEVPKFLEIDNFIEQSVTEELGLLQQPAFADTVFTEGSVSVTLHWGSRLPIEDDYDVCFQLLDADENSAQTYCAPVADCLPTSTWHVPEMIRSNYVFQLDDSVTEGIYELALFLQQTGVEVPATATVLGDVTVIQERGGVVRELETAVWGEAQIALPAYDVVDNGDAVALSLFWQAQEPLTASYKVFLHVIDNKTNELVAQIDFVPDNWVYQTNYWQCGEIVHDQVSLPLADLPSGEYSLLLGLYDVETGVRLPISRVNGQVVSDEIVRLAVLQR